VRLQPDPLGGRPVLLFPEGVLQLNATGAAILALCDGRRSVAAIAAALAATHGTPAGVVAADVAEFLARLRARRLVRRPGTEGQ
jgi:coenzyme PQQ biosynthesis protein PqqD